jgi:DNA polymerase III subunit epsilon
VSRKVAGRLQSLGGCQPGQFRWPARLRETVGGEVYGDIVSGPLAGLTVVVVDVETTGWLHDQAELTEIGAVRCSGGQLTGEFSSLVRPAGPIPADISSLTGISEHMVSGAPVAAAALRAFLAFAGDCVLVAHNAPFDLGFLTSASAACGIGWPPLPVLDTAVLARLLLGPDDVPDCRLATLAAFFDTEAVPTHRALADARATAEVLDGLLRLAAGTRPPGNSLLDRLAS